MDLFTETPPKIVRDRYTCYDKNHLIFFKFVNFKTRIL